MERVIPLPAAPERAPAPVPGFWRRRLLDPLLAVLAQGATPAALSRALAVGAVCAVFPFLGATTILTTLVGLALRLNQPVLQTLNQLLGPVQLVLIPVFVHLGARLLGGDVSEFSVAGMLEVAREGSVGEFLARFGRIGLYALVAWLVAAPAIFAGVFLVARPLVRRLAATLGGREVRS